MRGALCWNGTDDLEMDNFFGAVRGSMTMEREKETDANHPKRRREAGSSSEHWGRGRYQYGQHPNQWGEHHHHSNHGRDPLVYSLAKLALKQEEELKLLQQDTSMVLWFSSGGDSILGQLYRTAVEFKKRQQAEPTWGLAHVPLKQVMAQAMFRELRDRHQKVLNTPDSLKRATDMGWRETGGWRYQVWNPKLKALEHDQSRPPVPDTEMSNKLQHFVDHIRRDVVHRFHCTQRMTETMESKKTFKLDLSVRNKHAEEVWDLMVELQGSCVFQLIGLGYRKEKLARAPLAQNIHEMSKAGENLSVVGQKCIGNMTLENFSAIYYHACKRRSSRGSGMLDAWLSVQNLLDNWRRDRDRTMGFMQKPEVFALHLMRFQQKQGHTLKMRTEVHIDVQIRVPLFEYADRLVTTETEYTLGAYIIHHGLSPRTGHYTTALRHQDEFWHCDDAKQASMFTAPPKSHLRDCYVLFYHRAKHSDSVATCVHHASQGSAERW
ncbi:unnamed protein product [Symbiodinium sp. CCMP2592]|nr:unnamed protein product [Symbiodinium sp. CCMP2592]